MDAEKVVSVVTILIALGSMIGTVISGQRAVKKDAFADLQTVVELLRLQLVSAQDEIKELKKELQNSEDKVRQLQSENIELKQKNLDLENEMAKLRMRFDDTLIRKRNAGQT